MKLKHWLAGERGRSTALARHLGVSLGRVTQMSDGYVPLKHLAPVRDFTGGQVTLEEMVSACAEQGVGAQLGEPPRSTCSALES